MKVVEGSSQPHNQHHHQHARRRHQHRWLLPAGGSFNYLTYVKTTAYFILIILSYAFGYFSALSSLNRYPATKPSNDDINHNNTNFITPEPTTNASCTKTSPSNIPQHHNRFSTSCTDPIPPNLVRQTLVDRLFNGTSPFTQFPPPHLIGLLQPVRLSGWGSNRPVFETLIKKVRPKTIIEIGTFLGASAIHMADLTRRLGLDTQILCLDDFRGWAGFRTGKLADIPMVNGQVLLMYQFMQNVAHMNLTGSVLPVPFSTGSSLDRLCEWGVRGDLVEVDASHDFHSAWADVNRAYKVVRRPGGILFGHDYFNRFDDRGVRRAVDLFAKVNRLKVKTDGQHWIIGPFS